MVCCICKEDYIYSCMCCCIKFCRKCKTDLLKMQQKTSEHCMNCLLFIDKI
jgi:hypothetical protein